MLCCTSPSLAWPLPALFDWQGAWSFCSPSVAGLKAAPDTRLPGMLLQLRGLTTQAWSVVGRGGGGSQEASFAQLFILGLNDRTVAHVLQLRPCAATHQDLPPGPPDYLTRGRSAPVLAVGNISAVPSCGSLIWMVMQSKVRAIAVVLIQKN